MPSPTRAPASRNATEPSDAALVLRAREGDDAAFGVLVRRHERAARAVARALVGHAHDAEEIAQDALVRAHRNLDLLADPARFGAWLSRIVFGVAIDRLRAARAERRLVVPDAVLGGVVDTAPGPHERLERDDLAARVLDAVHALPERYRVPLSLYHLDGLSLATVAESLGMPAGTARSLVARARERLRATLAPLAVTDDPFAERAEPRFLHILNGDSVRLTLERSDVPGTRAVWADVLHDGPVPPFDVGEARWREIRADYHGVGDVGVTRDEALRMGERWDALVATAPEYDETVLWLEHDLFDQLLLIRHLAWFSERPVDAPPVDLHLICIGAWSGMPSFKGLGELGPAELASLLGTRQPVTQRQLALGRRAWRAFTGPDPRAVERFLAEEDSSSLPFLAAALRRNLEELPGVRDGLARTDRQILALVDGGVAALGTLFARLHALETNFYIGDWSFLRRLRAMAAGPHPLIRLTEGAPRWFDGGTAELTDDGRAVLAGRADAVRLRGIDTWLGGTHLVGVEAAWRWDPGRRRVVGDG